MIKKMSSKELMEVLENAEGKIDSLQKNVNSMKLELDRQLGVFGDAMEYASSAIGRFNERLSVGEEGDSSTYILSEQELEGRFSKYGITVTPYIAATPVNVFNFVVATGPVYKDNTNVFINSAISPVFANMLQHDACKGKETAFDEFSDNEFTLKVTTNPNEVLSSTSFNTIELLPFIPGSFDITSIRIYTMHDYRTKSDVPSYTLNGIESVGAERIILPQNVDLYSCEMDIKVNFENSAGKYPFGLRHLYFLNSNINMDSYAIFKIERNNYIDWVGDDIVVHDQDGIRSTTCTEEGIELYAFYEDGELNSEILPSKGMNQNTLARNIQSFYVKVPLKKSIISLRFKSIGER